MAGLKRLLHAPIFTGVNVRMDATDRARDSTGAPEARHRGPRTRCGRQYAAPKRPEDSHLHICFVRRGGLIRVPPQQQPIGACVVLEWLSFSSRAIRSACGWSAFSASSSATRFGSIARPAALRFRRSRIHPHVERPNAFVAEHAHRDCRTHRRNAQIREIMSTRSNPSAASSFGNPAKFPCRATNTAGSESGGAQALFRTRHLNRIDIDPDDAPRRLHAFQDRLAHGPPTRACNRQRSHPARG